MQFLLVCGESRVANCIGTTRDVNSLVGLFFHRTTGFVPLISVPPARTTTFSGARDCAYEKILKSLHFPAP